MDHVRPPGLHGREFTGALHAAGRSKDGSHQRSDRHLLPNSSPVALGVITELAEAALKVFQHLQQPAQCRRVTPAVHGGSVCARIEQMEFLRKDGKEKRFELTSAHMGAICILAKRYCQSIFPVQVASASLSRVAPAGCFACTYKCLCAASTAAIMRCHDSVSCATPRPLKTRNHEHSAN